jgi:hypothetical protein
MSNQALSAAKNRRGKDMSRNITRPPVNQSVFKTAETPPTIQMSQKPKQRLSIQDALVIINKKVDSFEQRMMNTPGNANTSGHQPDDSITMVDNDVINKILSNIVNLEKSINDNVSRVDGLTTNYLLCKNEIDELKKKNVNPINEQPDYNDIKESVTDMAKKINLCVIKTSKLTNVDHNAKYDDLVLIIAGLTKKVNELQLASATST